MKKVAIPIDKGRLSELFGHCNHYEIFEIEDGDVRSNILEMPPVDDVNQLPAWIAQQGITDVIAHRVNNSIMSLFAKHKINLFVGVSPDRPGQLIEQYMNGRLTSNKYIIKEITNNL